MKRRRTNSSGRALAKPRQSPGIWLDSWPLPGDDQASRRMPSRRCARPSLFRAWGRMRRRCSPWQLFQSGEARGSPR